MHISQTSAIGGRTLLPSPGNRPKPPSTGVRLEVRLYLSSNSYESSYRSTMEVTKLLVRGQIQ